MIESSSISLSEPKKAIKTYYLPIFMGLGTKLSWGKYIRKNVGKKVRVPVTLYRCDTGLAAEILVT